MGSALARVKVPPSPNCRVTTPSGLALKFPCPALTANHPFQQSLLGFGLQDEQREE